MSTRVDEAVSFIRGVVSKIRESLGRAESMLESKAINLLYNTSVILEHIAEMFERARCLAAESMVKTPLGIVARFCKTWQLVEMEDKLMLTRTKPATSVVFEKSVVRFRKEDITFEADAEKAKVCRKKVCLEYPMYDKSKILDIIPELTYVLRFIYNHVRKSREALIVCARLEKPACLSI